MLGVTATQAYLALLICTTPICAWVCWSDLKTMKIPNKAVYALVGIFLVIGLLTFPFEAFAWRWVNLLVVLAIGIFLNAAANFGAGDMKFAAAAALYFRPMDASWVLPLLAAFLLATLVAHQTLRAIPAVHAATPDWVSWQRTTPWWKGRLPVGLALAGTFMTYLVIMAFDLHGALLAVIST